MNPQHPWSASYPAGVPADIDIDAFPSIVSVLRASLEKFEDRPAFSHMGKAMTYAEVDRYSQRFAAYPLGELELEKGDRVANRETGRPESNERHAIDRT